MFNKAFSISCKYLFFCYLRAGCSLHAYLGRFKTTERSCKCFWSHVTLCLTLLSNVGNFLRQCLQKCTCKACLKKSVSKLCTSQFDIRTRLSHHSVSAGMLIKVLEATCVDIGSGPRCNISCGSRAHSCLFAHFQIFPTSVNLFDSRWPWDMWLCVQITLNHNDSLPFCNDEQHSSLLCVLVEKQEKKGIKE